MTSPASPIQDDEYTKLVARIRAARAALRLTCNLDSRIDILKELAVSTQELCELMMNVTLSARCSGNRGARSASLTR